MGKMKNSQGTSWWHFQSTSKEVICPKNFLNYMHGLKSARMAVPCQCSPQKCIIAFEKSFLFWVRMNIQKDWKAKLESAYSFMLKYSKITVCRTNQTHIRIQQLQIKVLYLENQRIHFFYSRYAWVHGSYESIIMLEKCGRLDLTVFHLI